MSAPSHEPYSDPLVSPIAAHLERYYGVGYAGIVPESRLALLAAAGLNGFIVSANFIWSESEAYSRYDNCRSRGALPMELRDADAFATHYRNLSGVHIAMSSVAQRVYFGPASNTPLSKQRTFERSAAAAMVGYVTAHPHSLKLEADADALIERDSNESYAGRLLLHSRDNLTARLPKKTNGQVVEYAPTIPSMLRRIRECSDQVLKGVAFINRSYFGREFGLLLAARAGVADRVYAAGDGLRAGAEELRQKMGLDAARYTPGFAAAIYGNTMTIPRDQIDSFLTAHHLLAARGVLFISGARPLRTAASFVDVAQVIDTAEATFGRPLRRCQTVRSDDHLQAPGEEALFIKQ